MNRYTGVNQGAATLVQSDTYNHVSKCTVRLCFCKGPCRKRQRRNKRGVKETTRPPTHILQMHASDFFRLVWLSRWGGPTRLSAVVQRLGEKLPYLRFSLGFWRRLSTGPFCWEVLGQGLQEVGRYQTSVSAQVSLQTKDQGKGGQSTAQMW